MAIHAWQLLRGIGPASEAPETTDNVSREIKLIWFARPEGVSLVADLGDDNRSRGSLTLQDLGE